MKKILFLCLLIVVLALSGCESELPPEPGAPGAPIGEAVGIYEGYGVPYDVFDNNKQIFFLSENVFNLEPDQESFSLGIKVEHEGGYIYKYGYYYTNAGWKKYEFPEKAVAGSNWIKDNAKTYLKINTKDITSGENYIVAYSCKKYDGQWKCGCTSKYGRCNQWMLQTYLYRNVELPPEPVPPGSIITTRIYISPNGEMRKEGDDVNIYVSFESTKDILGDIDEDEAKVRVVKPDNNEDWVSLKKYGDVNCKECEGEYCYRQFMCYLSFGAGYTPALIGEYIIDFGDIEVDDWMQIETGKFKVVSDDFFKEHIIEEDIGDFQFRHSSGWYDSNGYGLYASYYKDNTYISVYVQDYDWVVNSFEYIKNDENYEAIEIDGNIIYVKEESIHTPYYDGVINTIKSVWLSDGKLIRIHINGADLSGYDKVVEAYLEKHPSSVEEICKDSDGLDYFKEGKVTMVQQGEPHYYNDKCVTPCLNQDGTSHYAEDNGVYYCYNNFDNDFCSSGENCYIAEASCAEDNYIKRDNFVISPCPNGCKDGACIKEEDYLLKISKWELGPNGLEGMGYGKQWRGNKIIPDVTFDLYRIKMALGQHEILPSIIEIRNDENDESLGECTTIVDYGEEFIDDHSFTIIGCDFDEPIELTQDNLYHLWVKVEGDLNSYPVGFAHYLCNEGDSLYTDDDMITPEKTGDSCPLYKLYTKGAACTDSDGGKNYYVKGTCKYQGGSFTDNCDGNNLWEFRCSSNNICVDGDEPSPCPNGCEDGACIEVVLVEESWQVKTSTNKLEISENLGSGVNRETLRNVKKFLSGSELNALADGIVYNKKQEASPYKQYLYLLGPGTETNKDTGYVVYAEDDNDVTLDFLYFASEKQFARYVLEFTSPLRSEVNSDGELASLKDVEVVIFGKKYSIVSAAPSSGSIYLALSNDAGTEKIVLSDININDVESGGNFKVNDNTIASGFVIIEGSDDGSTVSINKIQVLMSAADDFYVPAGVKLSENLEMVEPEVLFTNNWDIEYHGLKDVETEDIEIVTSGQSKYMLKFNDGNNNLVNVPIAENIAGDLVFGDAENKFVNRENLIISENDYFVITDSSANRGERKTYILQYKGADKITADSPVLKFKDMGSGDNIELSYLYSSPLATLKIGGSDSKVYKAPNADLNTDDFDIQMDLDGDGALSEESENIPVTTYYGAEIMLSDETSNRIDFSIKTPDDERDENAKDSVEDLQATDITGLIFAAGDGVGIEHTSKLVLITPEDESNVMRGYTSYGSFITLTTNTPETLKIQYPKEQIEALVYITTKGSAASGGGGSSSGGST